MAEKNMSAVDIAEPRASRPVLKTQSGAMRVALPLAYVESCISPIEEDFLLRFFEAYCFTTGSTPVDADGSPVGRYVDHAARVDPDSYMRLEVSAYQWVRRYSLGRENMMVAEMFLRMEAGSAQTTMIDFGAKFVNAFDEKIALGGGQGAIRMLGIRLKDAYRDFFRWYGYVKACEDGGREPTAEGALKEVQREQDVSDKIAKFKLARGLVES